MDVCEIAACGYADALDALLDGIDKSEMCFTALSPRTGKPVAMFGVVLTPDEPFNSVWLLGTGEIEEHGKEFLFFSRPWVNLFAHFYGSIGNYVSARNKTCIKWLEWCGFKMDHCTYAPNGELMLAYVKDAI